MDDSARGSDLELESLVFTTNVKGYLLAGRYQPFVLAGMGFMRMESKVRDVTGGTVPGLTPHLSERTAELAVRFGGGPSDVVDPAAGVAPARPDLNTPIRNRA